MSWRRIQGHDAHIRAFAHAVSRRRLGHAYLFTGPSGIGKTTLGLHFLSQASAAEPGLLFGFFETPARLCLKARHLGLEVGKAVDRGEVEILWQPQRENV